MNELQRSAELLAGQKALALMLPSATDLLGREHVFSHEAFDLLEDGLSFERLPEQSVVRRHRRRPGETQVAGEEVQGSRWTPTFLHFCCLLSPGSCKLGLLLAKNT